MEQRQEKAAMVLKYAKRRFDGGNEAEMIRSIERQQDVNKLNNLYQPAATASMGYAMPLTLTAQEPVVKTQVRRTKASRACEVALYGPLQICIGVVGMLTATLAIVTARRVNNPEMLLQGKTVFWDCFKTLGKGFLDTATTPIRVLKVWTARKA